MLESILSNWRSITKVPRKKIKEIIRAARTIGRERWSIAILFCMAQTQPQG
jgi:hypothetical protein